MNLPAAPGRTTELGVFLKTASYQIVELIGGLGLDFAVIDAEHAPFDRLHTDSMILAGRAVGLPIYVRLPDDRASTILSALDMGAVGLLVPHVETADQARRLVGAARFKGGSRGFSGAPRYAGFGGRSRPEVLIEADAAILFCQIESAEGLRNAEAIAQVPGVDGLFIGRADLSLSLGLEPGSPALDHAVRRIADAALDAGRRLGLFAATAAELRSLAPLGADWAIVGSDQSLLRQGVRRLTADVAAETFTSTPES